MPTGNPFRGRDTIIDVLSPVQSVGAHLAAKLQSFASDEFTLTGELCDMLCIWLSVPASTSSGFPSLLLELQTLLLRDPKKLSGHEPANAKVVIGNVLDKKLLKQAMAGQ